MPVRVVPSKLILRVDAFSFFDHDHDEQSQVMPSLLAVLSNMSTSLGAYVRPNRVTLPTSTSTTSNYPYEQLNGAHKDSRRNGFVNPRRIFRYCVIPCFFICIFIFWMSTRNPFGDSSSPKTEDSPPKPVPSVDPFEKCAQALQESGIPTTEEITSKGLLGNPYLYSNHVQTFNDQTKWAKVLSADQLMDMLDNGEIHHARILHQSWKNEPLPPHFKRWSANWKHYHDQNWIYVLWRDSDNRKMVQRYYPEYLEAYDLLPREIYRADMVRNMYMHLFGGVYADLDLVALGPISDHIPILLHDSTPPMPIAYLGHMGDDNYAHSIPNAFMVSITRGHPFWLMPLQFVKEHQFEESYNVQPEGLTGPVALRICYREWEKDKEQREGNGTFAEVRVLSNEKIYPFSWYDSPFVDHCLCRLHSPFFNETRCHYQFQEAWTITYWTHSWGF